MQAREHAQLVHAREHARVLVHVREHVDASEGARSCMRGSTLMQAREHAHAREGARSARARELVHVRECPVSVIKEFDVKL